LSQQLKAVKGAVRHAPAQRLQPLVQPGSPFFQTCVLAAYGSGQEIYIYYTNGVGNSKLTTDFMERKLKVSGTGRNWNTLTKLLELTRA
jgi:hypothetical protein